MNHNTSAQCHTENGEVFMTDHSGNGHHIKHNTNMTEVIKTVLPDSGDRSEFTASAAYGLRNLSASYTGNVVDVRRSSDNAEDSFTAAEVADGTLVTWVGAGNDSFVTKWYDQSGNAKHETQGTDESETKPEERS